MLIGVDISGSFFLCSSINDGFSVEMSSGKSVYSYSLKHFGEYIYLILYVDLLWL